MQEEKKGPMALRIKGELLQSEVCEKKGTTRYTGKVPPQSYLYFQRGGFVQIKDIAFKGYKEAYTFSIRPSELIRVEYTHDEKVTFYMRENQEIIQVQLANPRTYHKPSQEKNNLEFDLLACGIQIEDYYVPPPPKKKSQKRRVKPLPDPLKVVIQAPLQNGAATPHSEEQIQEIIDASADPLPEEVSSSEEGGPIPEIGAMQVEGSRSGGGGGGGRELDVSSLDCTPAPPRCHRMLSEPRAPEVVILDSDSDSEGGKLVGRGFSKVQDFRALETTGVSNLSRFEENKELSRERGSLEGFSRLIYQEQPTWMPKNLEFEYRNQCATIGSHEMRQLLPQQYLNDNIIMSYVYLILQNLVAKEISDRTFVFDNFFVDKFSQDATTTASSAQQQDATHTFLEARKYSKRCDDLFQKDFWIIPACRLHHWIVYIVVNPGAAFKDFSETPRYSKQAQILALDSLPSRFDEALPLTSQYKLSTDIRGFMEMEYKYRACERAASSGEILAAYEASQISLSEIDVPFNQVRVPRQTNSFDCGIYLLEYLELFLHEPSFILDYEQGLTDELWFSQEILENKRIEMALLFSEMAHDRDPFPDYLTYRECLLAKYYRQPISEDHSFREEYLYNEVPDPHNRSDGVDDEDEDEEDEDEILIVSSPEAAPAPAAPVAAQAAVAPA